MEQFGWERSFKGHLVLPPKKGAEEEVSPRPLRRTLLSLAGRRQVPTRGHVPDPAALSHAVSPHQPRWPRSLEAMLHFEMSDSDAMEELIKPEIHLLSRFQVRKILAWALSLKKERKKLLKTLTRDSTSDKQLGEFQAEECHVPGT